jgi:hypothetical protein
MILDACLLVDGGYPYGFGWSGPWVHEHVSGLTSMRFGIVHIGPRRELPREPRYLVPDHVERVVERFPIESNEGARRSFLNGLVTGGRRLLRISDQKREAAFAALATFFKAAIQGRVDGLDGALAIAAGIGPLGLSPHDLLRSRDAYRIFDRLCEAHAPDRPLAALFRGWRAALAPLVGALRTDVPAARVYHAISTGPAGLLGALAASRTGAPLLVTIPGEPPNERAPESREREEDHGVLEQVRDFVRRSVYGAASEVVAPSEASRRTELSRGAPTARCSTIPDGVDVAKDLVKAADYYRLAAEQGLATAQYKLGRCYELGEGVRESSLIATEWYQNAARNGFIPESIGAKPSELWKQVKSFFYQRLFLNSIPSV